MNDFILRGFCQKCGESIYFDEVQKGTWCDKYDEFGKYVGKHPSEPVWFLSASQIEIVFGSHKYEKWFHENFDLRNPQTVNTMFKNFLEREPFLVSEILRKAGETK